MPADRPHTHWKCLHRRRRRGRRRPPTDPPLGQQTPLEPLERPSGCPPSLISARRVVRPRGGPESKGRPWQRPAGQPTWGDPDLRPPPVVASGLGGRPWPLQPCPTPARPPVGNPVFHPPAVQPGVTLSAAASVLPVSSLLTRSLQLQETEKKTKAHTPPRRRRRRPKLLRVTLSLAAGQQIQRPPASARGLTLHQRPRTIFPRPHYH